VAHVCYKASSDTCHTVVILDVAYGSVQHPAHNPVAVQTFRSQSHFLPYMTSSECDATTHDIINTPTEANHLYILPESFEMLAVCKGIESEKETVLGITSTLR